MKWIACGYLILTLLLQREASAGAQRQIDLADGTSIIGEVQSLSNGVYTVRSDSLGVVRIEESKIRSIHEPAPSTGAISGGRLSSPELKEFQGRLLRDPDVMNLILILQSDPEFKDVLEDPDVVRALNAGDIEALQANRKIRKLMDNPTVKVIEKKIR